MGKCSPVAAYASFDSQNNGGDIVISSLFPAEPSINEKIHDFPYLNS